MIDQKEIAMQANSISFRTIEDTAKAILAILNQLTDKYESHKSKQGGVYTKKNLLIRFMEIRKFINSYKMM